MQEEKEEIQSTQSEIRCLFYPPSSARKRRKNDPHRSLQLKRHLSIFEQGKDVRKTFFASYSAHITHTGLASYSHTHTVKDIHHQSLLTPLSADTYKNARAYTQFPLLQPYANTHTHT